MTYPSLTSPYARKDAAHELRRARYTLAYCREQEAALAPDDPATQHKRTVYARMQHDTRQQIQGMRAMLHRLFA